MMLNSSQSDPDRPEPGNVDSLTVLWVAAIASLVAFALSDQRPRPIIVLAWLPVFGALTIMESDRQSLRIDPQWDMFERRLDDALSTEHGRPSASMVAMCCTYVLVMAPMAVYAYCWLVLSTRRPGLLTEMADIGLRYYKKCFGLMIPSIRTRL